MDASYKDSGQQADFCTSLSTCEYLSGILGQDAMEVSGYADDATWVLTSSFVILTMQSGFGLLEMGNSVPGHEASVMLKNVYDVVFGALAYYFLGYGISYGNPSCPFMGLGDFAPDERRITESGLLYSRYLFQFSFAATSTTIVSGCIAMRMRFFVYCAFSFYAVLVYSFVAHWVWAPDGWLNSLGVHDFAGGGPVHLLGAANGLVGILMVGPRTGRFTRPDSDFAPSSQTSMLFGLFMLWWGWIGFNCGSSFGITNGKWIIATRAGVTTINSTAGGGLVALLYTQLKSKGACVYPGDIVNGVLGALVAITPACACVHAYDALIIGAIGAAVALGTNDLLLRKCKLDDPVGAIGVHGAAAIWGLVSVGLFSDSNSPAIEVADGLFRGGGFYQLGIKLLAVVAIVAWGGVCTTPFFYLTGVLVGRDWRNPRKGLRMGESEELYGADTHLHGRIEPTRPTLKRSLTGSRKLVVNFESDDDNDDMGEEGRIRENELENKHDNDGDLSLDERKSEDGDREHQINSTAIHPPETAATLPVSLENIRRGDLHNVHRQAHPFRSTRFIEPDEDSADEPATETSLRRQPSSPPYYTPQESATETTFDVTEGFSADDDTDAAFVSSAATATTRSNVSPGCSTAGCR